MSSKLYDTSEDRVLRIETDISELKVAQAETGISFKYLSQQVQDSTAKITEKIESCIKPISDRIYDTSQKLSILTEQVEKHDKIADIVLTAKKKSDNRRALVKKALLALCYGGGAVTIKELIVMMFRH